MCNFYVTDNEIYCNTRIHDTVFWKYTITTQTKLIVNTWKYIHENN